MNKKQIIHHINLAANHGKHCINQILRYQYREHLTCFADEARVGAAGYNLCAGNLARQIGIASTIYDKPAELSLAPLILEHGTWRVPAEQAKAA